MSTRQQKWKSVIFFLSMGLVFLFGHRAAHGAEPALGGGYWYRGNTHTHAQWGDGYDTNDVPTIAGWYKSAGYDFLVLSEHNNRLTVKQTIAHNEATTSTFLMIPGLELSRSRHTGAFGINQYIGNETSLQDAVIKTLVAGGIPILHHPQDPVVTASTFIATQGLNHFEVFNGGRPPQTPATEILWDAILSAANGRIVYAVAADDNHYSQSGVAKGWIVVRAPALTKADILENFRIGNFYATTGVVLDDYRVSGDSVHVKSQNGNHITFIGKGGATLCSFAGSQAAYKIDGYELYVRAKITNTAGKMAWTQPVFVNATQTSIAKIGPSAANPVMLSQNYPNPFNVATTIEFTLAEDCMVSLKVFDRLGREVARLVDGELKAGIRHRIPFDASQLSTGMYVYRIKAGNSVLVKKLTLLK